MHHRRHRRYCQLSPGRVIALVLIGVCLGIGLTVGITLGVRQYSPALWAKAVTYLTSLPLATGSNSAGTSNIDMSLVKAMVQEILASDQGKAVVSELISSQSQDTFKTFFNEAVNSPEFRSALLETLDAFLKSAEGKDLIRRVARDAMNP